MRDNINVLMTSVGGELGPELVNHLKDYDQASVLVTGVDNNIDATGKHFCDEFIQVPRGDDKEFLSAIETIIKERNINLLIPGSDEEALAFSTLKKTLETDKTVFACVDREVLDILSSKSNTYQALEKYDIPCAAWKETEDQNTLKEYCHEFKDAYSEFVVKPSISRGGRDVFVIKNDTDEVESYEGGRELHMNFDTFMKEYINELSDKGNIIIMERLFGPVHDLDMLSSKGESIYVIPRKRVNSMYPNAGHTIVESDALVEIGHKIIKSFNLSWLYDCDLMFDRDGNPKVIEINPRMSGSSAVTIKAGVPLLHSVIDLFLNKEVKKVDTPYGTTVIPYKSLTKAK